MHKDEVRAMAKQGEEDMDAALTIILISPSGHFKVGTDPKKYSAKVAADEGEFVEDEEDEDTDEKSMKEEY